MLGDDYLSRKTIAMLWKPQTTNDGKKTRYGMGWHDGTDKHGRYWVGHSGGSVGGTTKFTVYPKQKVVVAIISNLSDVDYHDIQLRIAGLFITDEL